MIVNNLALAQKIIVSDIAVLPSDRTAIMNPCYDINGDTCALVMISTNNIEGLTFPNKNQYINVKKDNDEYYAYVPYAINKINFEHSSYLPGQIDFSAFGFRKLKKGCCYRVSLLAERKEKNDKCVVTFKLTPETSELTINSSTYPLNIDGICQINLDKGRYEYKVRHEDYKDVTGELVVNDEKTNTVYVSLKPQLYDVRIITNVNNGMLFVDNKKYGTISQKRNIQLRKRTHTLRIEADGYYPNEINVDLLNNNVKDSYKTTINYHFINNDKNFNDCYIELIKKEIIKNKRKVIRL